MKVGDLVKDTIPDGRNRMGIIISNAAQKDCYVVYYLDGKSPNSNSYRSSDLRRVSEAG